MWKLNKIHILVSINKVWLDHSHAHYILWMAAFLLQQQSLLITIESPFNLLALYLLPAHRHILSFLNPPSPDSHCQKASCSPVSLSTAEHLRTPSGLEMWVGLPATAAVCFVPSFVSASLISVGQTLCLLPNPALQYYPKNHIQLLVLYFKV